jgi:ABC-type multidrug transport system fused ATPase/permease subunit
MDSSSSLMQLIAQYLKPLWPKALLLAALVLLVIGLQLANPQIVRYFIDTIISGGETSSLFLAAAAFLGVSLLVQGIGTAATYVGEDLGWQATNHMRADLALHCLELDMSFHNAHMPGEMIERIDGDITYIATFFSQFVVRVLGNLLLLIGVLVMLALEDWRVSLALLAYTFIGMAGLVYLRQVAVPYWKATRDASAVLFGFLGEQLAGTEEVRSNGAVAYVMRNLSKFNRLLMDKTLKSSSTDTLIVALWVGLQVLGQTIAFISGYALFRAGAITVGGVYLIVYYTQFAFQRLVEVATQIQNLQLMAASIQRVGDLQAVESKIVSASAPVDLPVGPLGVVFENVSFGYNEQEPVLQDVSFSLRPGKVLGLLGRTGSGKTTLTRLLFRLYDPYRGTICLGADGDRDNAAGMCNIRDVAVDSLRQRIGIVTQNVQLFQATVRDNVTFFDKSISDARILEVIHELGLAAWYGSLPNGLDTSLASDGGGLSAGEAQLLAFARVFLRDPGLVILDEASSRLDPATEQLLEQAIDRLLANRTGIIIAHRLGTIRRVDQIMIIEDGQVQETGEYAALARDPASRFYGLLQTGLEEVLA